MAENLLTVAALRTTVEADLIRAKLEAAGIAAVLLEPPKTAEGAPTGRVQVQVGPSDFERAMQLLFPIPQAKPAPKVDKPAWTCPKCGEQVLGQFPACWSCGTAREAGQQPGMAQTVMPSAGAMAGTAIPPPTLPPVAPSSMPAPPMPAPAVGAAPLAMSPRISEPHEKAVPPMEMPRMPAPPFATGPAPSSPTMNGDSASKRLSPARIRQARTSEDDALKIIVPPWDGAKAKGAGRRSGGKSSNPTEIDDRAARRAWWAAVIGIVLWPTLLYSIYIILVLGLSNRPLSSRGNRFFYGALVLNALFIAAAFAWLGTQQ